MTDPGTYWSRVSELSSFSDSVALATVESVLLSLPEIYPGDDIHGDVDWSHALFAASLVGLDAPEALCDGALRIAQVCLQSHSATAMQKQAAEVLLERLGNPRSISLARQKDLLQQGIPLGAPFELDVIRKRMLLSLDGGLSGARLQVNDFQRRFWEEAGRNRWLSVSASTSAGKSFIVKRWLAEGLTAGTIRNCAYVVPTRALIEEVGADLSRALDGLSDVFTLPWDESVTRAVRATFVVTQERLHLLQQRLPDLKLDLVFIDEAQKFGDGRRGILLQRVLDDAVSNNPDAQVIFASPLTTNPGLLTRAAPSTSAALASELVTVNQNLIHVNQQKGTPLAWDAEVVVRGELHRVGTFRLSARPQPQGKRLALVAVALGQNHQANVVYVNGAAEAEKVAGHIYEALGADKDLSKNADVAALIDLIERTIHPLYLLARNLRRGVAFHYGNMPLLVRQEIERLFRDGVLQYLVCTSTLLEGVNLPCQNIFVRGPKKGNGRPMSVADFWNLAGRAGRWGIEFQGNVVCVDVADGRTWSNIPITRQRQPMSRATDVAVANVPAFVSYIERGCPLAESRDRPEFESLVSLLSSRVNSGVVSPAPWLALPEEQAASIYQALGGRIAALGLPQPLIDRHAGINPFSIRRLFSYFQGHQDQSRLILSLPESTDAAESYVRALSRVNRFLGGDFSAFAGRQYQIAILLVNWMRGYSLARLIADRVNYWSSRSGGPNLPTIIRAVMADVEQLARYQAPLYLACYVDTLREALPGNEMIQAEMPDIAMLLELGVARGTDVAMMSLGLSRTSVVSLQDYIVADDMDAAACVEWLRSNNLRQLGLPVLVVREIEAALARLDPGSIQ